MENDYHFINRQKGLEKFCYILAGYKDFLWDITMKRIERFIPKDIDVCLVSSGLYSEKLSEIALKNNWSYLYTKENRVGLAQNLAIRNFPKANWIYKIDEDIFVTKGSFEAIWYSFK